MTLRTFDDALTLRRRLADASVATHVTVGGSCQGRDPALSQCELDTVRLVERDSWLCWHYRLSWTGPFSPTLEAAGVQADPRLSVDVLWSSAQVSG